MTTAVADRPKTQNPALEARLASVRDGGDRARANNPFSGNQNSLAPQQAPSRPALPASVGALRQHGAQTAVNTTFSPEAFAARNASRTV